MKINVNELKEALTIVKPGLAGKAFMEQTTSFAFLKGLVVTYNDEVSIKHQVKGLQLQGAIEAEQLYSFLSKVKKDEIEVEEKENEILFKSGRAKAGFTLGKEIKLPLEDLELDLKWVDLPEGFVDALGKVKDICALDMSRPMLTCVHVTEKGFVEATDGFRIYRFELNAFDCEEFLLPTNSAKKVVDLNPVQIANSEGWVHFKNEIGTIISCRVFDDKYVNIDKFINIKGIEIKFPNSLLEVLDKAEVFSKRDFSLEETVSINIEDKKLKISSKSDVGWYKDELPIHYRGKSFSFSVSPASLKVVLDETKNAVISEKFLSFTGKNWKYISIILWKE